jgi:outer membrane lipoprotein-sorting protein
VVVTGWSDGRISWPRCRALDSRGHGSGLLVDEELARAVRSESAAAVMYWWGISCSTVWLWRTALGVEGWTATEGTRRLVRTAAEQGGEGMRRRGVTPRERARRRRTAERLNLGQYLDPAHGAGWSDAELRLLGTAPDDEVARRIGRPVNAVRIKRARLGIPNPEGPGWTEEELALLGTAPDEEVAARIGPSCRSFRRMARTTLRPRTGSGRSFVAGAGAPMSSPVRGTPMRSALLVLLLPALAGAGEGNEAEKLYRALESKVTKAKSIRVTFAAKITGGKRKEPDTVKGVLELREGDKGRGEVEEKRKGKEHKWTFGSDGKKLTVTDSELGQEKEEELPKDFGARLRTILSRIGPAAMTLVKIPPRGWEKVLRLSGFNFGKDTNRDGRAVRVLEYKVTLQYKVAKHSLSVKLWLDTATGLPVQREVRWEAESPPLRVVETYSKFKADARGGGKPSEWRPRRRGPAPKRGFAQ